MGRLDGLTAYLERYGGDDIILTFFEIESLTGTRLPLSARRPGSSYWSNSERNVYAKAWLSADHVVSFDECEKDEVRFTRRDDSDPAAEPEPPDEVDVESLPPPPPPLESLPPPPETPEDRAARVATELTTAFAGKGFLPSKRGILDDGWESLPDVVALRALQERDADALWIRLLATFGSLLDRGRGDPTCWSRVATAFDADYALFDPEQVLQTGLSELMGRLDAVGLKGSLTTAAAWRLLSEALAADESAPALRRLVNDGSGDGPALLAELTTRTPAGRNVVPGLSTPKAVVRWIRTMVYPGGSTIDRLDQLPIVVDADTRRATEFLGVTDTGYVSRAVATPLIEGAWVETIAHAVGPPELAGTALALDQALSFVGRSGCGWCKAKLTIEPITPACAGCRLRASS